MADRGKVIKGLKCCTDPLKACPECPYQPCYDQDTTSEKLLADALELLKAQEARVMSREEIENTDDGYIWFEDKAQKVMQARYFRKGILFEIGCLPFASKKLNWETYGTLWRYWTAMPTDEQRRAAKWDA